MRTLYKLSATARGVLVRAVLDDVPVLTCDDPAYEQRLAFLNPWLTSGSNALRLQLAWPNDLDPLRGELTVEVQEIVGEGEEATCRRVLSYAWPPEDHDERIVARAAQRRRHEVVLDLVPAPAPPVEYWRAARPIELTDASRLELLEHVVELQRAFDRLQIKKALEVLRYRNQEIARALFTTVDDLAGELAAAAMLSLPDEVLDGEQGIDLRTYVASSFAERLEPELEVYLVAEGRVAWVTRGGFAPALRIKGPPMYVMHAYLGVVDGRWTFVR